MTKVKICGIKSEMDADILNRYKPDYAGFIFDKTRKRYLEKSKAAELRKKLDNSIKTVGVFVNADMDHILEFVHEGIIDIIQLHGDEDEKFIEEMKQELVHFNVDIPVVKAFGIKNADDIKLASASSADMVLLDTGRGGTGKTFDWDLIRDIHRDYVLAGGLTPENVRGAVDRFHPYAVDVSGGVETDGKKDEEKIKEFVRRVRDE